jgi:protein ImuB
MWSSTMKRIVCVHWNGANDEPPLDDRRLQIVECCGRFSPTVGFDPNDDRSVFLDITGLAHLFGGEPAMIEAIVRDLRPFGTIRVAVADTLGAAWAAVHYGGESAVADQKTAAFLHSLPIEALRLPAEMVRLLHELGLVRIGQLESLPREEFLSRFGPVLLLRLDQTFGRVDEPLPASPLPPKFEAGWSPEHPTARRETIAAAVEWLIARLAAMLAHCGRGALRLDCRLFLDHSSPQSATRNHFLSVGLFQPTAEAKRLVDLVQIQFERLRIAAPVTAIEAAASLTATLEPCKQATLFDLDGDQRRPRRLAALVERMCSRLGNRAVVGVRLRSESQPELAWQYVPLVGRPRRRNIAHRLPSPLPPRPLRLLPRPLAAAVTAIAPDGPPLRLQFDGHRHEITRSWGPERIAAGWWRGQAIGRDYFQVETAAGHRFWLFRRLRDGKWFLHGAFE